jgi:hypothetical protein
MGSKTNRNLAAKRMKAINHARYGGAMPRKVWSFDTFKGKQWEDYVDGVCADRRVRRAVPPTVSAWAESGQVTLIRNGVAVG